MIHTMKELCKRYHVNDIKTHVFTKEEYDYINSHIIRYLYTSSNCRYGVIKYQKNNGKSCAINCSSERGLDILNSTIDMDCNEAIAINVNNKVSASIMSRNYRK